MIGEKYGRWEVISEIFLVKHHKHVTCRCECGTEKSVRLSCLLRKQSESCGCLRNVARALKHKKYVEDLVSSTIGSKFGRWTVIAYGHTDKHEHIYFKCVCDCGTEKDVSLWYLTKGVSTHCGCITEENYISKYGDDENKVRMIKSIFRVYKYTTYKKDRDFDLTLEHFTDLIKLPCHYCGVPSSNIKYHKIRGVTHSLPYNGVDRVDNDKGYTVENTVPCCSACNRAKMSQPVEDFISWILRAAKHLNNRPMK